MAMRKKLLGIVFVLLICAWLSACGKKELQDSSTAETWTEDAEVEILEADPEEPEAVPNPDPNPDPGSDEGEEEPEEYVSEDSLQETETAEPYLFGSAVEESDPVDESWFEDAVFLGDSRTGGLQIYSGLHTGDFFWYTGINVFQVNDPDYRVIEVDGEKLTLVEALAQKEYSKVYLMLGLNEAGYPASSYAAGLQELLEMVKEIQPNAVIYLQTLPPVNEEIAKENNVKSWINNSNISTFNQIIMEMAAMEQVAVLDVASVFRSEQGDLPAELTSDGVHFTREGYELWYEYLKTHTLDPQSYAAGVPQSEIPSEDEQGTSQIAADLGDSTETRYSEYEKVQTAESQLA